MSLKQPTPVLPRSIRDFLHTEIAGGLVLLVAAVVALVVANTPLSDSYERFWESPVSLKLGSFGLDTDARHFVNEGLMVVFFFVVGLEIKRELVVGELRDWRTAAVPVVAALGGMAVPAVLYLVVANGEGASRGWGVPMATDIAFALGVLALAGSRIPSSAKLFLLTLAVADDVGAIVVIALFYSASIDITALLAATAALAAITALQASKRYAPVLYILLAIVFWLALAESGVHATLAGVVLGLIAPARPTGEGLVAEWARDLDHDPDVEELAHMSSLAAASVSPAERMRYLLHPWSSFVIVPVFALANAGVKIDVDSLDADGRSVALAVVVGLVAGKLFGVFGATWLAVRLRVGTLPEGLRWSHVWGIAAVAGVGFTVSLFVAGLAFDEGAFNDAARIGIVAGSVLAGALGFAILRASSRATSEQSA